jgi:ADP-ribose pyrophosphatase YjhB (NUDIX family)
MGTKKERQDIFKLFLEHHKLRFNEIEKRMTLRSNMVAYHLEQMRKEGLLEKKGEFYKLTAAGERALPRFPHDESPLPVVLVAPVKRGKVLLIKRSKRPYQGYWGLIGGKVRFGETFTDAASRLVREKARAEASGIKLCAMMREHVMDAGTLKHDFLLFLTRSRIGDVKETDVKRWFSASALKKERIIPSDLRLIAMLSQTVDVEEIVLEDIDGELLLR